MAQRTIMKPLTWFGIRSWVIAAVAVCVLVPPPSSGADPDLFRDQVLPLLTGKCLTCHGADKKRGGLDLSTRANALKGGDSGTALKPGQPADSLLLKKLVDREMPPQNPLTPEQVEAMRRWIEAGAPYVGEPLSASIKRVGPEWWSLQPIKKPSLPSVTDRSWPRTQLDAFILDTLEKHGLRPAPEADVRTLIRRVTFDLTGLPPTPEEIDAFERAMIAKPLAAYEALVDRLLASPHYGERWGRHWLDVVRFAESHGYEMNQLRNNAWPYRDYVIRAFNQDTPFPRFIEEQLAADALTDADSLTQCATGFLVGGAHDAVGNSTIEGQLQQRMDDLDDMIATTSATFLGLTVNCARCHDHKFDPIAQKDYYGLQAIFAGVQHAERPIAQADSAERQRELARLRVQLTDVERKLDESEPLAQPDGKPNRPAVQIRRNIERFEPVEAKFLRFTVAATNNGIEPCIDELEVWTAEATPRNVALAKEGTKVKASSVYPNATIHRLEHINDGLYGNSRSWISNERGKGWVELELPGTVRIDRIVWGRDREVKFQDRLPVDYRIEKALEPGQWRTVASSADRQPYQNGKKDTNDPRQADLIAKQSDLQRRIESLSLVQPIYAGSFMQPGPTHLLTRGDPMRKADAVLPSGLSVIQPPLSLDAQAPEKERRLALARWIGRPDNPLTARVMVNRVWHYHFGTGLVDTPSDFGSNGGKPSHPELLDFLASEFIASGWRLKPLHRLIVLSSTYRQSGRIDPKAIATDRNNRWLWRMMPRRLEAEPLRDAVLSVSGKLDRKMNGPGYYLWEKNTNYVVVFTPKAQLGPDEFRRMVYQFKPRSQQDPTFGVFDCPDAALARPKRTTSTTVLQALNLLNDRFLLDQADALALRLQQEAGTDAGRQVDYGFHLTFGRAPTAAERQAAVNLVTRHGLPSLTRALFNANEFLYVD